MNLLKGNRGRTMAINYHQIMERADQRPPAMSLVEEVSETQTEENELKAQDLPSSFLDQFRELVREQNAGNEELREILAAFKAVLEEMKHIYPETEETALKRHREALRRLNESQKRIEQQTIQSIQQAGDESLAHIKQLEQESRRRTERLARITLSTKFFTVGRAAALLMVLFLLAHAIWNILA